MERKKIITWMLTWLNISAVALNAMLQLLVIYRWFAWQILNRASTQDRIKQGLHFAKYCSNVTGIVANACRKKTMLKYDSNSYFPRTDDGCPMLVVGYVGGLNRTHTPDVVFLVKLNAWVLWGNM